MYSRALWIIFAISASVIINSCDRIDTGSAKIVSKKITESGWSGFKQFFIDSSGKVNRIEDGDVVSEGQAYAMLRAVWMDDKECFDNCYRWTEDNLSRVKTKSDNLLAWQWKQGEVYDWMPASDADIDYALSLIFADYKWSKKNLIGVEDYGGKAKAVLSDILDKETFRTLSGKLYLGPWVMDDKD
ncbi:MAG TPA: glycosyl hydrolase family 8, partial [Sedimentisphaerales bacterium]|nr:glycosyl hydrolase family 8 [Sedimentisphaerales bacterium]